MNPRNIQSLLVLTFLATVAVHAHEGAPHAAAPEQTAAAATTLGRPGDPAKVTRTVKIVMHDSMRFTPSSIRVRQGETIRFRVKNRGRLRHELVLGSPDELRAHAELMTRFPHMEHDDPNAVSVAPGGTRELVWQFTRAGNVHFACLVPGHFEAGMRGTIVVETKERSRK